jgi:hypothetical protein
MEYINPVGFRMRIILSIAIGACAHIKSVDAQYTYPGCGPCVPMMPCPCPMTGMSMMQAPQLVMQATPVVVQAVPQPSGAKPCDTSSTSASSSQASSTTSVVTGTSLSTDDISGIITQLLRAELTGHWTELMQTINQFLSRSDTHSVTHNYYSQYNYAEVSQTWSVFLQSLIDKIERQGVHSDQDRRNLIDLQHLLDHPPAAVEPSPPRPTLRLDGGRPAPGTPPRVLVIEDGAIAPMVGGGRLAPALPPRFTVFDDGAIPPAVGGGRPAPATPVLVPDIGPNPNSPMAFIAPLAIGWNPKPGELIPEYAGKIVETFDPRYNRLVRFLANWFGQVCNNDADCETGAETMAKLLVTLNVLTDGTGTIGLPKREFIGGDWINVGGTVANDDYIQLLRDGLTKFHNQFCLRGARPRCDQMKPELVRFLNDMLVVSGKDVDDQIRSFVGISLTNGFHAVTWKRILGMNQSSSADDEEGAPAATGRSLTDLAKEITAIAENRSTAAASGDVQGSESENQKAKIEEMIRELVLLPGPNDNAIEQMNRLNAKTPIKVSKEVYDIIRGQIKQLAGVDVTPMDVGAVDLVERQVQQGQRAQAVIADLLGDTRGPATVAGQLTPAAPTTSTDIVVAAPPKTSTKKGGDWTDIYAYVPDADDESQGALKMVKQPVLVFAKNLQEYLVQGVRLNLNRQGGAGVGSVGAVGTQQLVIYGQGGSDLVGADQSVVEAGDRIDEDKVFDLKDVVMYNELRRVFHNTVCGAVDDKKCRSASNTMANVMAYVHAQTRGKAASSLEQKGDAWHIDLAQLPTDDTPWKRTVGEALARIASNYCTVESKTRCKLGMEKIAKFLGFVAKSNNADHRKFVKMMLWDGLNVYGQIDAEEGSGASRVKRVDGDQQDTIRVLPAASRPRAGEMRRRAAPQGMALEDRNQPGDAPSMFREFGLIDRSKASSGAISLYGDQRPRRYRQRVDVDTTPDSRQSEVPKVVSRMDGGPKTSAPDARKSRQASPQARDLPFRMRQGRYGSRKAQSMSDFPVNRREKKGQASALAKIWEEGSSDDVDEFLTDSD